MFGTGVARPMSYTSMGKYASAVIYSPPTLDRLQTYTAVTDDVHFCPRTICDKGYHDNSGIFYVTRCYLPQDAGTGTLKDTI